MRKEQRESQQVNVRLKPHKGQMIITNQGVMVFFMEKVVVELSRHMQGLWRVQSKGIPTRESQPHPCGAEG